MEGPYRTRTGRILTDEDIDGLAAGAERGYDPAGLVRIPSSPAGDPCPQCGETDLEPFGGKKRCPACKYLQPCCQP